MRGWIIALAVAACSRAGAKPEPSAKHEVVLAPQPVIKNGVRDAFVFDPTAVPLGERPAALERALHTVRIRLQLAGIAAHVAIDGDRLLVDTASDPEAHARAVALITETGHIELRVVDTDSAFMTALGTEASVDGTARADRLAAAPENKGAAPEWFLVGIDADRGVTPVEAPALCPHERPVPFSIEKYRVVLDRHAEFGDSEPSYPVEVWRVGDEWFIASDSELDDFASSH